MYIHVKTKEEGIAIIKILYNKGWNSRYDDFNSGYWNLFKEKTLIEFADNFDWSSTDNCKDEYISCDKFLLAQPNIKPAVIYDKSNEKLDVFHYHEAHDRLYVIIDSMNTQLIEHPVFIEDKFLSEKLQMAIVILTELYQTISSREQILIEEYVKK